MEDRPADRKRPRPETEGSAPYDRRDCCEGRDADRSKRDGSEENRTGGYLVVGNGGAGEVAMPLCIIDEELLRGGALY